MIWSISYWMAAYQTSKKLPLRTNYYSKSAVRQKIDFLLTDPFNAKSKHRVTETNLLNLAGGIPVSDFVDAYCRGYSVNENVYKIEMTYDFGFDSRLGRNLHGRVMCTIGKFIRQLIHDEHLFIRGTCSMTLMAQGVRFLWVVGR